MFSYISQLILMSNCGDLIELVLYSIYTAKTSTFFFLVFIGKTSELKVKISGANRLSWVGLTSMTLIFVQMKHKPSLNLTGAFSFKAYVFALSITSLRATTYTSEPAWLWAGTMTATAPVRVSVEELVCGEAASGSIWGWAPSVLLGTATTGLRKTCGGPPLALGRLCFRDGVPPTL